MQDGRLGVFVLSVLRTGVCFLGFAEMHLELTLAADGRAAEEIVVDVAAAAAEEEEEHFERLSDAVVLCILNRVGDIKALGRCCVVSRRFNVLVPQVENVVVKVDCVISGEDGGGLNVKGKGILTHLLRFVVGSIVKPLQALHHLLVNPKKAAAAAAAAALDEVSHHSPSEVLRNFKEIQKLRIELPGGELGIEDGVLLKWKAEFGSTLESCVILGASAIVKNGKETSVKPSGTCSSSDETLALAGDESGSIPESFYTNGGLKLRVVWTISSLIAASARHFLLQQIISDHPTLQSLVLTDSDAQGVLCMGKDQLQELRDKPLAASASSNRTQVPALNMKLWYAPYLELPGGMALKGATLVAIRPSDQPVRKESDAFVAGAFDEPFKTAASLLVRRRTYLLEMNSF